MDGGTDPTNRDAPEDGGEGVVDKAKDLAGDLAEKAKPVMDKAGEVAGGLFDKAKRFLDKDDAGGAAG